MKKILIVEDEGEISKAYGSHLKNRGFDVEVARNGKEGIVSANSFSPDLILLDIIMPVYDGLTMLEQLKFNKQLSHIPVIILTNLNTNDSIAEAMVSGVTNYLIKSDHSIEELDAKIDEVLGNDNKKQEILKKTDIIAE
jgi:DNA-binding response OmpR family regulator